MADTTNPNAVAGEPLTEGSVSATSVAGGGGTYTFPGPEGLNIVRCEGDSTLSVEATLAAATAAGDLAVAVYPVGPDGLTVLQTPMPVVQESGPTLSTDAYYYGQYDVNGLDAVQIIITNNNVAAKDLTAGWRLS